MIKKCYILETAKKAISQDNQPDVPSAIKKYIFSGPCAEFDITNENGRIYDKEDYLRHVDALQEDITANRLLGEVDHDPNDLDPKRKAESHIIKKLWWNEEKQQVWITIELLNNSRGKDIMAAVDQGVPIYISSRASGYVDENNKVILDAIYTYDIVYRPGFKNAKLDRINESLGIKNNQIAIIMKEGSTIPTTIEEKEKKYVTIEDMEKFSNRLNESLIKMIRENNESNVPKTDPILEKTIGDSIQRLERRYNKLSESLEKNDYNEDILESINDMKTEFSESLNHIVGFINESLKPIIDSAIAKNNKQIFENILILDSNIDTICKSINQLNENDSLLESGINKISKDSIFEIQKIKKTNKANTAVIESTVNKLVESTTISDKKLEFVNEKIEKVNSEITVEEPQFYVGVNESISNKMENLFGKDKSMKYNSIMVSEDKYINNTKIKSGNYIRIDQDDITYLISESSTISVKKIDFDVNLSNVELIKGVDKILEKKEKERKEKQRIILEGIYPFIKTLNPNDRNVFESLSDINKEKIKSGIESNEINETNISEELIRVKSDRSDNLTNMLEGIDERCKNFYNSLDKKDKDQLLRLYISQGNKPGYQTEVFWETVLISNGDRSKSTLSSRIPITENASLVGYSDEQIDNYFKN